MPTRRASRGPGARAALLAAARELFLTRGYDGSSVDAINARAGLSKGTFYHYFRSKSDLLDALVDELTDEGWRRTRQAMAGRGDGALERFSRFLAAARRWRIVALPQTAQILRAALRPENAALRERMQLRSIALACPDLAELLAEGVHEGVFHIDDPAATARVFMVLAHGVSDDLLREVASSGLGEGELLARLVARGRAFMRAAEALLGVARGALGEPEGELLAGMVRAFRAAGDAP